MDSVYVALKSIKDNSWLNTENISLLIALLAVIFGPIIAYYTAKRTMKSQMELIKDQISAQLKIAEREIKSKVLSNNRQEWINSLRDNISEFMSLILIVKAAQHTSPSELLSINERLFSTRFRISLLLNPKEDDHKNLDELLETAIKGSFPPEGITAESIGVKILNLSKSILKREWERVKKLE
jgi:hypothetical protein